MVKSDTTHAGKCFDWVRCRIRGGRLTTTLKLSDNITLCTCASGIGKMLSESWLQHPQYSTRKRIRVAGIEAGLATAERSRHLFFWVADRCVVRLDGPKTIPEKKLIEAVGILDLTALKNLCRKR